MLYSRSFFVTAFSNPLCRDVPHDVEILAGLQGVLFAHSQGWTNIWVEFDSELAVRVLCSDGSNISWCVRACWTKFAVIRPSLQMLVTHSHREGNSIVDLLAKLHLHNIWIGGCPNLFLINCT